MTNRKSAIWRGDWFKWSQSLPFYLEGCHVAFGPNANLHIFVPDSKVVLTCKFGKKITFPNFV